MTGAALAAAAGGSPLWYATRATGVIALVLLTATVLLGVAASRGSSCRACRASSPRDCTATSRCSSWPWSRVHVLTTVLDSYTRIGLTAAVVPVQLGLPHLWLGLGAVALDLLLAVVLTSLLRDRLPYRAWRAVHWLAYASLARGAVARPRHRHRQPAAVAAGRWTPCAWPPWRRAAGWRLSLAGPGRPRTAADRTARAPPAGDGAVRAVGPLQPGWARRAGHAPQLLGSSSASAGRRRARPGGPA